LDAAARIVTRLSGGVGNAAPLDSDTEFVRAAYRYVLGGEASGAEEAACLRALAAWRAGAVAGATGAVQAARANLVWALLNHNDFVTLR
jgi:hypothetical protein